MEIVKALEFSKVLMCIFIMAYAYYFLRQSEPYIERRPWELLYLAAMALFLVELIAALRLFKGGGYNETFFSELASFLKFIFCGFLLFSFISQHNLLVQRRIIMISQNRTARDNSSGWSGQMTSLFRRRHARRHDDAVDKELEALHKEAARQDAERKPITPIDERPSEPVLSSPKSHRRKGAEQEIDRHTSQPSHGDEERRGTEKRQSVMNGSEDASEREDAPTVMTAMKSGMPPEREEEAGLTKEVHGPTTLSEEERLLRRGRALAAMTAQLLDRSGERLAPEKLAALRHELAALETALDERPMNGARIRLIMSSFLPPEKNRAAPGTGRKSIDGEDQLNL